MLHNKYFEVLGAFAGDYMKGIYGRALVGKVAMSQKNIALTLEELERQSILSSKKEGSLKYYKLNWSYSEIKDVIAMFELMRKIKFMAKQRKLAHLFRQDSRIIGIFGSYAKGTQKQDSDIDVFIIGKKVKDDYGAKGRVLDLKISAKYFTLREWAKLLKAKNALCKEIIENHIIMFGVESFIRSLWGNYYGLD